MTDDRRPPAGGGDATPSVALPAGGGTGIPGPLGETEIGARSFRWGERTFVMGIVNVTPDSFSGDGLLVGTRASGDAVRESSFVDRAVAQAQAMAADGADILDVGGESTRPGHGSVDDRQEAARVVPVISAIRAALPDMPISIDTTKRSVAAQALDRGADFVNTVWGVDRPGSPLREDPLLALVAERACPIVLMHNRLEARYTNLMAEVIGDLERSIETALALGIGWDRIIVDPGFGFGKAPVHNIALLAGLAGLRVLGRPILLGTSRKSTLGKVLDLPPDERLEATLATTALGIAAGADIVRVHDVRANVRVARMTDAIVRRPPVPSPGGSSNSSSDPSSIASPVEPAGRPR